MKRNTISTIFPIKTWRSVVVCCWLLFHAFHLPGAQTERPDSSPRNIIAHSPRQPRSGEPVTISARFRFHAQSAILEYQRVDPGQYIALKDPNYQAGWVSVPMTKTGDGRDARFEASIPGSVQAHRRLVRYRFRVMDKGARKLSVPSDKDPEPNFAYFSYDGIPPWKAAIQPGSSDPNRGKVVEFTTNVMAQVQSYFLLSKKRDIENATWYERSPSKDYVYTGTFVSNGEVYDHVGFRARGGAWRYAMGKNMWKINFNKSHRLEAVDDYGVPYRAKWDKLNLRACIQQGDYGRRGEQGMYESVGFRLFNLAGVDAPRTHWISLRIVDDKVENPANQYEGDFWGLYLAIENEDSQFLEEHGLPDGNMYKMMLGRGELVNPGNGQTSDYSDIQQLISAYQRNNRPDSWWRSNVDLSRYYSYRAIIEAIHHYDVSGGKNYNFYFNPETGRCCVIPWDIDLTWGDHMFGDGVEPFLYPVLSRPAFRVEYLSRLREIRDLLFNSEQADRLIDECAAIISPPGGGLSIVDADRAKWDYHPIMVSRHVIRSKASQGLFYRDSPTRDFAGMVRQMKNYVKKRSAHMDKILMVDRSIPTTPVLTYTGKPGYPTNALSFKSSSFAGSGRFAAQQWRVGEVEVLPEPSGKPTRPGHYEITAVWDSGELSEFKEQVAIPPNTVEPGRLYRARARLKDHTGRWSHWSAPIQFVPAATP